MAKKLEDKNKRFLTLNNGLGNLRSIPTFKIVVNVNCPDHLLVDFLTFKYLRE